jgi:pyruvate/2-oxoglutarate dehydrogenase complex dihydrolipoamide dehydrogenase (E3) component
MRYDLVVIGSGAAGQNHPTLAECYKVAALDAQSKLEGRG